MDALLTAVFEPFGFVFDPSRRLFWGFLLSSLLLALAVLYAQDRGWRWRKIKKALFNPRYWLHPSSLQDAGYLLLNGALKVLIVAPLIGGQLAATAGVAGVLQTSLGDAPVIAAPAALVCIAYTLVFFFCEDLSRYGLHRAMHGIPWLWRLHRVHHSAAVLTPLTLYRVHPVEMSLYYCRGIAVFAAVSGLFIYLFRGKVGGYDILGVDALGFLFNFFGANLRHSHIWLSFGRFEKLLMSPAQHQIHHSNAPEHRDKNFGTCLACWDRLAGTLVMAGPRRKLRFGCDGPGRRDPASHTLAGPDSRHETRYAVPARPS